MSRLRRLSDATLGDLPGDVGRPRYDRAGLRPSIVHLGPGVFHRAHQAAYSDALLAAGARDAAICAISLRSTAVRDALAPQDGLYTLVERDDDTCRARVIGAVREVLVAPEDPAAVLDRLTRSDVRIVTLTVTEKGYCATGAGDLDLARPEIVHDRARPAAPVSVPGFLLEALVRRRAAGIAPFAIASCDNLRANGRAVRRLLVQLAELRGGDHARWIEEGVACPSSMVDRMVPATSPEHRLLVEDRLGLHDAWPVLAEPFTQWVLEDAFPDGRPAWETVGVELVPDVAPYETAKLRILNGAHSAAAYLGLLAGHERIDQGLADPPIAAVVSNLLRHEVLPTVPATPALDGAAYAAAVLARFANGALGYRNDKVAADGSQKLPVRILGTVQDRLAAHAPVDCLTLVVAAWVCCLLGPRAGGSPIADPVLAPRLERLRGLTDPAAAVAAVLAFEDVFGADLPGPGPFASGVHAWAARLWGNDLQSVLADG